MSSSTGIVRDVVRTRQQIEAEGGPMFRVKRAGVVPPPRAAERGYRSSLVELVDAVRDDINNILIPELAHLVREAGLRDDEQRTDVTDVAAVVDGLKGRILARLSNRHLRDAEESVQRYFDATSTSNRMGLARQIKRMIGVDAFPRDRNLEQMVSAYTRQNAELIQSLGGDYVDQVSRIVRTGVQAGDRASVIAEKIRERHPIARRRAEFIARDQVSKLQGNLTRVRQTSLGIDSYIWRTSRDERVRESHLEKEGKIFRWDDPPADTGHPGQDFNCRCTAEPYIPEEPPPEDRAAVIAEVEAKQRALRAREREAIKRRRERRARRRRPTAAPRPRPRPSRPKSPFKRSDKPIRPRDPEAAETFDAVDNWVEAGGSRGAYALKAGAKAELGLEGVPFNKRDYTLTDAELTRARAVARRMYEQTQSELKARGVKSVRLYRGIKARYTTQGAVESWTTDPATARKFTGRGGTVIVDDVPRRRILVSRDNTHWHNGRFGEQFEYIVTR